MFYLYRCTTNQLVEHLERIEDSGDTVRSTVFVGGRDWILVCQKASADTVESKSFGA